MRADEATILVALAQRTEEIGASPDEIKTAWDIALVSSRAARIGRLVAECESRLTDAL